MSLSNEVIWVSGATGTLGAAIASLLAVQGAVVIASGRKTENLPTHENIHPYVADVTNSESLANLVEKVVSRFGKIDGLVTTTTLPIFGNFLELDDDDWLSVINTKLLGTTRAIKTVLPHFISRGSGNIVVLSGRGGLQPPPQHLPGSSVNAALNLLVQGLATQYGPAGVRINAISPGPIQSPRNDAIEAAGNGKAAQTPIAGPGLPSDVAEAVAFMLSPRSRFVSGTNLLVDGGGKRNG